MDGGRLGDMGAAMSNRFILTPGPLPWKLVEPRGSASRAAVRDAAGRVVCTTGVNAARDIVRFFNSLSAPSGGAPEARKSRRQEDGLTPANS